MSRKNIENSSLTLEEYKSALIKEFKNINFTYKSDLSNWLQIYEPYPENNKKIFKKDLLYTIETVKRLENLSYLEKKNKINSPLMSLRRMKLLLSLPTVNRIFINNKASRSGKEIRGLGDMTQNIGSMLACIPDQYYHREDIKVYIPIDFIIYAAKEEIIENLKTAIPARLKIKPSFYKAMESIIQNTKKRSKLATQVILGLDFSDLKKNIICTKSGVILINPTIKKQNENKYLEINFRDELDDIKEDFPFIDELNIPIKILERLSIWELKKLAILETKIPSYTSHPQLLPIKIPLSHQEIANAKKVIIKLKLNPEKPTLLLCANKARENIHKSWPAELYFLFLQRLDSIVRTKIQIVLLPTYDTDNNNKIMRFSKKLNNIEMINLEDRKYFSRSILTEPSKMPLRDTAALLSYIAYSFLLGPDSGPTHFYCSLYGNGISTNASIYERPQRPNGLYATAPRAGKDNSNYKFEGLFQFKENAISPPTTVAEMVNTILNVLEIGIKNQTFNIQNKEERKEQAAWFRAAMWKLIRAQDEFGNINPEPFFKKLQGIVDDKIGPDKLREKLKEYIKRGKEKGLRFDVFFVENEWINELYLRQLDISEKSWQIYSQSKENKALKKYYNNIWEEIKQS